MQDRRTFLKHLVRGAGYAAPVVLSFAAPSNLAGQSSQHHPKAPAVNDPTAQPLGGPAPGRPIRPDSL